MKNKKLVSKNCIIWTLFFVSLLFSFILAFMNDIPERDLAGRYAPMAEAFAVGNWDFAFHPRIPVLFPACSGVLVACTGLDGMNACKFIACLFFAAGIFPLFGIFNNVFGQRVALWGCFFYAICSHLIRIAADGFRDPLKSFAFFLALYGLILIWQKRNDWIGYAWCGIGCGMLPLIRGDCCLYALLFLLAGVLWDLYNQKKWRFPWRATVTLVIFLILLVPGSAYNYVKIGYMVPELRLAQMAKRFEYAFGLANNNTHCTIIKKLAVNPQQKVRLPKQEIMFPKKVQRISWPVEKRAHIHKRNSLSKFVRALFKGFYPYFSVIALVVIFIRIRKRQWTMGETILLSALTGHAFLLIMQIIIADHYLYVSRRYLLPIAPLSFGWTAIAWIWGLEQLNKRCTPPITNYVIKGVCILFMALFSLDAAGPLIKNYTSKSKSQERMATLQIGRWILNDYMGDPKTSQRTVHLTDYVSNCRPLVMCDALPVLGYISGGQNVFLDDIDIKKGRLTPDYVVVFHNSLCEPKRIAGYSVVWDYEINSEKYTVLKKVGDEVK